MEHLLTGFLIGIAYVAPIGLQNLFLINSAVQLPKPRAYTVAAIIIFMDISLAIACFFGIGLIMDTFEWIKLTILGLGSLIIFYIGISLIRSKPNMDSDVNVNLPLPKIALTAFIVTWLNPQALIDGSMLLGANRASIQLAGGNPLFFILGVALASCVWFLGLTTLTLTFKKLINEKTLRVLNIICGVIICFFAVKLGYTFFTTLF